jgi:hypothetical protein
MMSAENLRDKSPNSTPREKSPTLSAGAATNTAIPRRDQSPTNVTLLDAQILGL